MEKKILLDTNIFIDHLRGYAPAVAFFSSLSDKEISFSAITESELLAGSINQSPEKREFLSIYYHCEIESGNEQAGEKFAELKWVKPSDVKKYFTTSLHPKILEYLKSCFHF